MKEEEQMKTQTIIVESNEAVSRKNYKKDFGLEASGNESNSWSIKLPRSIKVNPGDELQYYQSSIKTRGLDSEKVELIGTAEDEELTDNEVKIDFNYYVNNNWLNNAMLPLGLSSSKYAEGDTQYFRLFDFQDNYHSYNILDGSANETYKAWLSDYGGPALNTIGQWIQNSAYSLYSQANEMNYTESGLPTSTIATNNFGFYTPDEQRLYLGKGDFAGIYNNGYDGYHNVNYTNTVTKEFELKTDSVDVKLKKGFNSPIVLGNDFTRALNREIEQTDYEPMVIDYKNIPTATGTQDFTGYYKIRKETQMSTNTQKVTPTTFGQVLYDLKSGKETFSINQDTNTKTNIPLMTSEQMSRYFWNNILTGDINRTLAMSKLYNNLYKSKNVDTISETFLDNVSYFSGDVSPETKWDPATDPIVTNAAYPTSQPYNFGEQMVVLDDLSGFSTTFVQSDLNDVRNNRLVKYDSKADFNNNNNLFTINQQPAPSLDKYLSLSDGKVIMSNMVANNENFEKLKKVQDYLKKYDVNNNEYFSLELGQMDDLLSQSVFNINNDNNTLLPREEDGILMPVCLPCVNSIANRMESTDTKFSNRTANRAGAPYENYGGNMRLPLYAGLFCDKNDISKRFETYIGQASPNILAYTHLNRFRSNKMYELDFHSKYSQTNINNVQFPDNSTTITNKNGQLFDDSKIKELDLGVVVGYKNIRQQANDVREIGLGTQQSPSQYSFYSVDTTTANYNVNTTTFVNTRTGDTTNNFGDNSVSSGQGGTTNGTLYLSQNTGNIYSETGEKEIISASKAVAIEYDSITGIKANSLDLYQQASFPDGSTVQTDEILIGAGAGRFQCQSITTAAPASQPIDGALNNIQDTYPDSFFSADNNVDKVITFELKYDQAFNKMLFWKLPTINASSPFNESPKFITISASSDNVSYTNLFTNVGGTGFVYADYPDNTTKQGQSASGNLSDAKVFNLNNTTKYKYYRITVTDVIAKNPASTGFVFAASEIAFTINKKYETILGAGKTTTQFASDFAGSSLTPTNLGGTSSITTGFDNLLGNFDKCLFLNNAPNPATLLVDLGANNETQIDMVKIWARSDYRNEMPRKMKVEGSNDNSVYTPLFDNQATPFNTGVTPTFLGDYPVTSGVVNQAASSHLDLANTIYMNQNAGLFRYYKFTFIENSGGSASGTPTTVGSYLMAELALYREINNNNTQSRLPKSVIIQGQKPGEATWTTIENKSLTTAPEAAGYAAGPPIVRPDNPTMSSLTPPFKTFFNDAQTIYRKLRLIITESFSFSQNAIAIGEMVVEKDNNIEVLFGNGINRSSDLTLVPLINRKQPDGTYEEDVNDTHVNIDPTTPIGNTLDGNNHTITRFSMNTDTTYSTSQNQVFIGNSATEIDKRWVGFQYAFDPPLSADEFVIWSTNVSAETFNLAKEVEIQGLQITAGATTKVVELFSGNLKDLVPAVTTTSSVSEEPPYNTSSVLNNDANETFDVVQIIVKSTYNAVANYNNLSIADWILSGYDDDLDSKQIPFIGFVCRNQISSKNLDASGTVIDDKYKIPLPIAGEFFGIPRSLQNNSFSFLNSWERKVVNDTRGFCITDVKVVNGGTLKLSVGEYGRMLVSLGGGGKDSDVSPVTTATIELDSTQYDGQSHSFTQIISGKITNNGAGYYGVPTLAYSFRKDDGTIIQLPPTDTDKWIQYPQLELTIGDYKTSYEAGTVANTQPQYPYVILGANQPTMDFDTEESRMSIQNLHTPVKNGQRNNNMERYFDGSMVFNSEDALVDPDSNSAQNVVLSNNAKFNCNSSRAGLTEGKAEQRFDEQFLPVSNPAIKQIGYCDSLSGIGINQLSVKNNITKQYITLTESNYRGTLLEKLGFDLKQLLPDVGNQSERFELYLHNEYLDGFDYYNMSQAAVKPFTTNSLIPSTINQDTNINNIGYLIGSIDGSNSLLKIITQEPGALIANNLAQKLAYSHLLVYTNILPKYSYVGAQSINELNCIGRIDRSYTLGDCIFGNTAGEPYVFDKAQIISEITVDLRTETGLAATIDRGSTVVFRIVRRI